MGPAASQQSRQPIGSYVAVWWPGLPVLLCAGCLVPVLGAQAQAGALQVGRGANEHWRQQAAEAWLQGRPPRPGPAQSSSAAGAATSGSWPRSLQTCPAAPPWPAPRTWRQWPPASRHRAGGQPGAAQHATSEPHPTAWGTGSFRDAYDWWGELRLHARQGQAQENGLSTAAAAC